MWSYLKSMKKTSKWNLISTYKQKDKFTVATCYRRALSDIGSETHKGTLLDTTTKILDTAIYEVGHVETFSANQIARAVYASVDSNDFCTRNYDK